MATRRSPSQKTARAAADDTQAGTAKPTGAADNDGMHGLREQAQQLWMSGLGAFARAQLEGNKIFETLVKDTGSLPQRTRKAAQEQFDDVGAKAAGTWDKLEQVFEKRVAKALNTLGVPSHEDVDALSRRVAELTAAVQALQAPTPAAKVKKAAKVPAAPTTVRRRRKAD